MEVEIPKRFARQIERHRQAAAEGSARDGQILDLITTALVELTSLACKPTSDSATIKRVRQSKRHEVWRISHPFIPGLAVRVICWFPPDHDTVVVALFSGEKATIGDAFYDSVGTRADQVIQEWNNQSTR